MKRNSLHRLASLLGLALGLTVAQAETAATRVTLRLEARTNGFDLVVGPVLTPGVLTIQRAGNLVALTNSPELVLQTNTPNLDPLRVSIVPAGPLAGQAFFRAVLRPEPTVVLVVTNIPSGGGRVQAPISSPLAGLVLEVPAGSYSGTRNFALSYTPLGSGRFSEFATPITPVINVDNGGDAAQELMSLTIPVSLATNEVIVASLFRPETGVIQYVPVVTSSNGTATILTRHFSSAVLEKTTPAKLMTFGAVETDFHPLIDNWEFRNQGTFAEPRGSCLAMCLTATWYLDVQKASEGQLYNLFDSIPHGFPTPGVKDDNVFGWRCVGLLQRELIDAGVIPDLIKDYNKIILGPLYWPGFDLQTFIACYLQMRKYGKAQTIVFGADAGHAVVAYAADWQRIYVADPNQPDQPSAIEFNGFRLDYSGAAGTAFLLGDNLRSPAALQGSLIPTLWNQVEARTIGNADFPVFRISVQEQQSGQWIEIGSSTTDPADAVPQAILAHGEQVRITATPVSGPVAYDTLVKVINTNAVPLGTNISPADIVIPVVAGTTNLGVGVFAAPELVGVRSDQGWAGFVWLKVDVLPAGCDCPITSYPVPVLVDIPVGTFVMGSPASEPARYSDEGPQTTVTISRAFKMGKYEVTQGEYLAVMGYNPSYSTTQDYWGNPIPPDLSRPVEEVSWHDATNYCCRLTACEARAGRLPAGSVYRLPTEAEWEYACRAGTTTPFHYGAALRSGMENFDGYYEYPPCGGSVWYCYNPSGTCLVRTTSVGSYAPNAWGLYDMHGNVREWCQDWYGAYAGGSVTDPRGSPSDSDRVLRGGDWLNYAGDCRSAVRSGYDPVGRRDDFGFRVVLAPGQ